MANDTDLFAMMVKFDERQRTIFNMIARVEKHLEKLNGKVAEHEKFKIQIKSYWIVISVLTPLLITLLINFM